MGRTVRFRHVRNYNLGIALGSECSGFQKGQTMKYTATIHIVSCFNIVQGIGYTIQSIDDKNDNYIFQKPNKELFFREITFQKNLHCKYSPFQLLHDFLEPQH